MSDSVNTITLLTSTTRHAIRITNESDGNGESAVSKLDISGLIATNGIAPVAVDLLSVQYSIGGFNYVVGLWDHTTDDEMFVLSGNGFFDFMDMGGPLKDPRSGGGTGDVLLTTDGALDGAHYDITLKFALRTL